MSDRGAVVRHRPEELVEHLAEEPFRFEFFEAVRRLTLASMPRAAATEALAPRTTGAWDPYEEHVRFKADIGLGFPESPIRSFKRAAAKPGDERLLGDMTVTFMALAGSSGVLPTHYTQLLIDRVHEKDDGLRDFLDLFNHRLIAHFYQAWAKCRFFVGYEASERRQRQEPDAFTRMLFSLVGLGTTGVRNRQSVPDEVLLYYAGHFAHRPRSAVALQHIVQDMFRIPTEIGQFRGQWMTLRSVDQTRLRSGGNNCLGRSTIAGRRVWGIENAFRVSLGPVDYETFERFLPGHAEFVALGQMVRSFVGPAFDFDLQIVLSKEHVPSFEKHVRSCEIGRGAQLGRNTWLFSRAAPTDVGDAAFTCAGWPTA